jgi:hypothetical protein
MIIALSLLYISVPLAFLTKALTTTADATKQIIHNYKFGEF